MIVFCPPLSLDRLVQGLRWAVFRHGGTVEGTHPVGGLSSNFLPFPTSHLVSRGRRGRLKQTSNSAE